MDQAHLRGYEWSILGLAGCCCMITAVGAVCTLPRVSQSAFNDIWGARLVIQLTAVSWAVCQLLPLQVLWDPSHGVLNFLPDAFPSQVMCKAYTVASLGVCQPFLLFLSAALCRLAVRYPSKASQGTWKLPVVQAFIATLPFAGLQVLCAWWSSWLESTLDSNHEIKGLAFTSFDVIPCPNDVQDSTPQMLTGTGAPSPSEDIQEQCVSCKYAFNSMMVLIIFASCFVGLILWFGNRLIVQCGNVVLRSRVRLLCILLPILQLCQLIAAAVTLFSHPFQATFELGRLAAVLSVCAMLLVVSTTLVVLPLRSAQHALSLLPIKQDVDSFMIDSVPGLHYDHLPLVPRTGEQLLPLTPSPDIDMEAVCTWQCFDDSERHRRRSDYSSSDMYPSRHASSSDPRGGPRSSKGFGNTGSQGKRGEFVNPRTVEQVSSPLSSDLRTGSCMSSTIEGHSGLNTLLVGTQSSSDTGIRKMT